MATKSTTKGDLLQIMVFTFLLCTLFFGAWGIWVNMENKRLKSLRGKAKINLEAMEKSFKDDENRQHLQNWRNQRELRSKAGSEKLLEVVNSVIRGGGNALKLRNTSDDSKVGTHATELSLSLGIEDSSLKAILDFCERLEQERPDVKVKVLEVTRARSSRTADPKAEPEDLWTASRFAVTTYVPKEGVLKEEASKEGEAAEAATE